MWRSWKFFEYALYMIAIANKCCISHTLWPRHWSLSYNNTATYLTRLKSLWPIWWSSVAVAVGRIKQAKQKLHIRWDCLERLQNKVFKNVHLDRMKQIVVCIAGGCPDFSHVIIKFGISNISIHFLVVVGIMLMLALSATFMLSTKYFRF